MNIDALKANRQLILAVAYGFAIGLSVGILLEASGALVALDRRLGQRKGVTEDPSRAAESLSGLRTDGGWVEEPDHELVAEAEAPRGAVAA